MPEKYTEMGNRIYEHYLRYGKTKKKLKRRTFMKRYGYRLKRKKWKTLRTRSVLRDIGSALTEAEKRRITD